MRSKVNGRDENIAREVFTDITSKELKKFPGALKSIRTPYVYPLIWSRGDIGAVIVLMASGSIERR